MPLGKHSHLILIALGTLLWSLTMFKSGLVYDFGMGFWGPNGHDGIWHIALIESLSRGSLGMPIFAGETIKNYHLGFDILTAGLHVLTRIPVVTLYFQIIPPILAFLIGLLVYKLTQDSWSVFFTYFGGSLGWVLGKGESTFWSQQSISTLVNPPFALSLVFILLGLISLRKNKIILPAIFFALAGFSKIYAVILILPGLLAIRRFRIFTLTLVLFAILFVPLNSNSSQLLAWQPGWFLETMMGLSDRLNWPRFFSAMITYGQAENRLKQILAYAVAFGIFVIGNFSTRLLAFLHTKKSDQVNQLLFIGSAIGVILPMLLLQKGTPWNTIQFSYYSLFFFSLLAGPALSALVKPKKVFGIFIALLVVIFTVPTTLDTLSHVYLPARPPAQVSKQELEALNFLSGLPQGVVLTYPAQPDAYAPPPRALYQYESTAYVSALSRHVTYLEDEVNLNITDFDWPARRKLVTSFFIDSDPDRARVFLQSNHIAYIYLPEVARVRPLLSESQLGFSKIFENSQVAIWADSNP